MCGGADGMGVGIFPWPVNWESLFKTRQGASCHCMYIYISIYRDCYGTSLFLVGTVHVCFHNVFVYLGHLYNIAMSNSQMLFWDVQFYVTAEFSCFFSQSGLQ